MNQQQQVQQSQSQDQIQNNRNSELINILMNFAIFVLGLYLHLSQISVLELGQTKLLGLKPTFPSSIFTASMLIILLKLQPFWPRHFKEFSPRFLRFLIELGLTVTATEFMLRQLWIPGLKATNNFCEFFSEYLLTLNRDLLQSRFVPAISEWFRFKAYYVFRYVIALIPFLLMLQLFDLRELHTSLYVNAKMLFDSLFNRQKLAGPPGTNQEEKKIKLSDLYPPRTRSSARKRARSLQRPKRRGLPKV